MKKSRWFSRFFYLSLVALLNMAVSFAGELRREWGSILLDIEGGHLIPHRIAWRGLSVQSRHDESDVDTSEW